ncbi:MAG: ABC transporter permease [Thermoplasmata archaeon]|nr:ABC transporter permease [Thermoplasmata archaeon]
MAAAIEAAVRRRAPWRDQWTTIFAVLRANPLTLIGSIIVALIVLTGLLVYLVPLVTGLLGHPWTVIPYSITIPSGATYLPPSATHLFGTDAAGRDVFSRVLAAVPVDLSIGLSITLFALAVGGALGLVAGFWDTPGTLGGVTSAAILRITDIFLAFPSLVLALAIASVLGRGFTVALFAIAATWWPFYVRLVRGEVLAVKGAPYIVAARAAGLSDRRILSRHVIRNILEPLVVYYTLDVGSVLITFSTITFLGIGLPPGTAEWGSMISAYRFDLAFDAWPTLFTGLAVFITVLAFSLLGDGMRDILDPRSRRALAVTSASVAEPPPRGTTV